MRLGVRDNGFDQVIDLARCKIIATDFTETAQSLRSNMADAFIRIGDKGLKPTLDQDTTKL